MNLPRYLLFLVLMFVGLSTQLLKAQLGFCNGNSGDPIFTETFGTGTGFGPALGAGITTYSFANGTPNDGSYTIANRTNFFDWHDSQDHTPNDINGKSLIVNADFTAGEFYRRSVTGLCENTSYEFSSWLMNLLPATSCGGVGIPVNVRFEIWDATDTNLLASGDTGAIANKSSAVWEQYGLVFQTIVGQTSVILKMLNNGVGGCGNDLAIDDIVFRTCGDFIAINDAQNANFIQACAVNGPVSTTLTATPDFSIYSTHAYQWQESADRINWTDIAAETNQTYTINGLLTTNYYRVKVAEDPINLASPLCSSVSEIFEVQVVPPPDSPLSNGDVSACVDAPKVIAVTVPPNIVVDWYDAPTGGTLVQENSTTFSPTTPNTFYAEARSAAGNCISLNRTAVSINFIDLPVLTDEELTFCENETVTLSAGLQNQTYLWNTGEITETINVSEAGIYTVTVTNASNCSNTKTINLGQIDAPVIDAVQSDDYAIQVTLANEIGDFEYSIDGFTYQDNALFTNIEGGLYTVFAREKSGCGLTSLEYLHLVIPKFFSPNGDGINDVFNISGIEFYDSYEIAIFDRFGKLIKNSFNIPIDWDGTLNNQDLTATDYWYVITLENTVNKGHFSLKR